MPADDFEPKLGRIRDPRARTNLRTTKRILEHAAKSGAGLMRQRSHILPGTRRCGMAPGVLARAGLIAPGSRRVIVRARYARQRRGDQATTFKLVINLKAAKARSQRASRALGPRG